MGDRPFDLDRAALLDTTVVVPGAAARELVGLLEDGARSRPPGRQGVSRDVDDVARLLRVAARRTEALVALRSETLVARRCEIVGPSVATEGNGCTVREAADLLDVKPRRVQQMVREGGLRNLTGRRPFILDRDEVEALAEKRKRARAS